MNQVNLVGYVGADPEVLYLEGGSVVAKFRMATNESYKNKQGEKVEQSEWHNIEIWGNLAKVVDEYVKSGSLLQITGKLKTDSWEDEGVKKYRTKINAFKMRMYGGSKNSNPNPAETSGNGNPLTDEYNSKKKPASHENIDDLPF